MTLRDVAADAGVALNTARKAVQGDPTVRPRLRERVLASARRLRYRPNVLARSLKQQRLEVVPISVAGLEQPYFGALAGHLSAGLVAAGLEPALCTDPARLLQLSQTLHTCGSILAYVDAHDVALPLSAHQKVVTINAPFRQRPNLGCVGSDFRGAFTHAAEQVLACGRRRVAILSEVFPRTRPDWPYAKFDVVEAVLAEAGLEPVRPAGRRSFAHACEVAEAASDLDAVFCENDVEAAKVLAVLTHRGLRVPDDVLIVGCDANLPLTGCWSIRIDTAELAGLAVGMLRQLLDGASEVEPAMTFPQLVDADGVPL